MRLAVYTDFDGTITLRDCNITLAAAFHSPEVSAEHRRTFLDGRTPLWAALDASLRSCAIPLDTAIRYLLERVPIDPTFAAFDAYCRTRDIPLHVVSAGLHEVVSAFLAAAGLDVPVTANQACVLKGGFGLSPLSAECPTGVDKAAIVAAGRRAGYTTVFVGDGLSDRLAVREADVVYAKDDLARFCAAQGVTFVPFERFEDIQRHLEARLAGS